MYDEPAMRIILFVVMVGAGVLVIWMARSAAGGRLKRNALAGIRIPSTMASDDAWRAGHVRAERPTVVSGYIFLAMGLGVMLPVPAPAVAGIAVGGCIPVLGCMLYAAHVAGEAAAAVTEAADGD